MRYFSSRPVVARATVFGFFLTTICAGNLGAQTPDQLVRQGRDQLTKQTPAGLRKADELFTKALAKKPDHAAANVLKTATSFALVNRLPSTISTLELLGIGTHETNVYDPEYSISVDTKGRLTPAKSAATKQIKDWNRRVALPQIDAALGRLAKVRNPKFLLVLSKSETSDRPMRIDYGDVHGVRFGLLIAKAIVALQDTYDSDASFYTAYQMIRRGELDLETFLKRYPLLLTKAGPDQRALSKRYFLAAESAYRLASPVFRARDPKKRKFHFLTVDNMDSERDFRRSLAALRKSFKSPQRVGVLKVDLQRALETKKTPRSLLGRVRGNAFALSDPTLGGVLRGPKQKLQSLLQKQAKEVTKSLNASYPDPIITSDGSAEGKVGRAFRYQIRANLRARSFATGPLPVGLVIAKSGLIKGTPRRAGTFSVKVFARTNAGTASRVIAIKITR